MTQSTAVSTCRACDTLQRLSKIFTFYAHPDSAGKPCRGSGMTRSQIEDMLRTFHCWENTDQVSRRTALEDNADSVNLINTLLVHGDVVAAVSTRLQPPDVLRLIDELSIIARERGWQR